MPRYFKRLGAGRKTKLSQARVGRLSPMRGMRETYPYSPDIRAKLLRMGSGYLNDYLKELEQRGFGRESWEKEFLTIADHTQPTIRKGHLVFVADFNQFPHIRKFQSPGRMFANMIFMDANVPPEFRQFVVNHEIRENILDGASYHRSHSIAVERELRDLKRAGLSETFLAWLKVHYPKAYRKRMRRIK